MAADGEAVPLSKDDYLRLRLLLWPAAMSHDQLARVQLPWLQGLEFYDHYPFNAFFIQHKNGPCGLIASIQALMLQELLHPSWPQRDLRVDCRDPLATTPAERRHALVRAIAGCLWRVGGTVKATLVVPLDVRAFEHMLTDIVRHAQQQQQQQKDGEQHHLGNAADNTMDTGASACGRGPAAMQGVDAGAQWTSSPVDDLFAVSALATRAATSLDTCVALVDRHYALYGTRGGLVLLLLSLLVSRGLDAVRADFASDISSIVGDDSCGEQALVNLCLTGRACNEVGYCV